MSKKAVFSLLKSAFCRKKPTSPHFSLLESFFAIFREKTILFRFLPLFPSDEGNYGISLFVDFCLVFLRFRFVKITTVLSLGLRFAIFCLIFRSAAS